MPARKGQRLYVNLPASQVRRRLKNFGHGVRKVESAGRGQALIIHTATGDHLRELEGLFADAHSSEPVVPGAEIPPAPDADVPAGTNVAPES